MKKAILLSAVLPFLFASCKKDSKSGDFSTITKNYFKDKNELEPLNATLNGQNEFNDQFVFEMTDSYRKKQDDFYNKYENELAAIDAESLTPEEKISYEIIKWETAIGKDLLKTDNNLMPIHQFWGTHLTMTQFASATAAQPFKTEKD